MILSSRQHYEQNILSIDERLVKSIKYLNFKYFVQQDLSFAIASKILSHQRAGSRNDYFLFLSR